MIDIAKMNAAMERVRVARQCAMEGFGLMSADDRTAMLRLMFDAYRATMFCWMSAADRTAMWRLMSDAERTAMLRWMSDADRTAMFCLMTDADRTAMWRWMVDLALALEKLTK